MIQTSTRALLFATGCFLTLVMGVWPLAHAQTPLGISLEPTDCCEYHPQFAPPPPAYPPAPAYPPQNPYRYHPPRYPRHAVSLRKKQPDLGLSLGHSRLWMAPDRGNINWDIRLLRLWVEGEVRPNFWLGTNIQLLHLEGSRWPQTLQSGDFWASTRRWLDMDITARYGVWYMRAGWMGFRETEWGLPDATALELARSLAMADSTTPKNTLQSVGDNWILPYARTGLHLGPIHLEAGADLLGWDLRSYRLHSSLSIQRWGLGVQVIGAYQEDGVRLKIAGQKDAKANDIAQATWKRRFWEINLGVSADLSALLAWNKNRWIGPLQIMFGASYRHILENELQSISQQALFREIPGGQWFFFAGLQVAFGQGSNPSIF